MSGLISFVVGVLFALGLGISGMTQTHVVRGFLDVFGTWDWSLMGVMMGAIAVHAVGYKLIFIKKSTPFLAPEFQVPAKKDIDAKLILGAAIFGLGWGWAGICPGPGIVSLASGESAFLYFIGSMLVGMKLFQLVNKKGIL